MIAACVSTRIAKATVSQFFTGVPVRRGATASAFFFARSRSDIQLNGSGRWLDVVEYASPTAGVADAAGSNRDSIEGGVGGVDGTRKNRDGGKSTVDGAALRYGDDVTVGVAISHAGTVGAMRGVG